MQSSLARFYCTLIRLMCTPLTPLPTLLFVTFNQLEKTTQENSRWLGTVQSLFGDTLKPPPKSTEQARRESEQLLAAIYSLAMNARAASAAQAAHAAAQPMTPTAPSPARASPVRTSAPASPAPNSAPAGNVFYSPSDARSAGNPYSAPSSPAFDSNGYLDVQTEEDTCTYLGSCTCPKCR